MSYLQLLLLWSFGSLVLMLLYLPSSSGTMPEDGERVVSTNGPCPVGRSCYSVLSNGTLFSFYFDGPMGSSDVYAGTIGMAYGATRNIVSNLTSLWDWIWNQPFYGDLWAYAPSGRLLAHTWIVGPPCVLSFFLVFPLIWALRSCLTLALHYTNRVVYNATVRDVFFRTNIPTRAESSSHTHPAAARGRSLVSEHSQIVARKLGLGWYSYQMSSSEAQRGMDGERLYYWSKDVNVPPKICYPASSDIKVLIDVASHVDLPSLLTSYPGVFYIYDVLPESACFVSSEVVYCFNEKGEIVYDVSGGSKFVHKLWSYDSDTLSVSSSCPGLGPLGWIWNALFGSVSVYSVERRKVAANRAVVLFNPKGRWVGPMATLSKLLHHDWLHRFDPIVGGYARFKVQNDLGWHFTTGRVNQYCCTTIPVELDGLMVERASTAQVAVTPALLEGCLAKWSGDKAQAAAIMAAYLKSTPLKTVERVSLNNVHNYQFEPYNTPGTPKPVVVQYMRGMFVDGAFSPDRGIAGQTAAVKGRILKPAKDISDCTPFVRDCIADFISEFRREGEARIHPVSVEEVWDKQSAPTQRRILTEAFGLFQKVGLKIKTFVKAESYGKLTHPRIISQVNPKEKLDNSRYTYALQRYIKERVDRFPWFTCGMTPVEIAQRVAKVLEFCRKTDAPVAMTDGSRLDGTISELANDFLHALLGHVFMEEYAEELHGLIDGLVHQMCQFAKDLESGQTVSYNSVWARLSGSPWTSIANTLWTAFGCYLALRHKYATLPRTDAHVRAWIGLGANLGDDGLSEDAGQASWDFAAQQTGIDFEVETAGPGMRVSYLARMFGPDAWNGCLDSCCDLLRTLGKFHVVPANADGSSPAFKLISKCLGLIVSDANTPVVGHIVRKVFELADSDRDADRAKLELRQRYGLDYEREKRGRALLTDAYGPLWRAGYMSWWSSYSNEEQWPNRYGTWMSDYAESCGLSLVVLQKWMLRVNTLRQFMDEAPLLGEAVTAPPPVLPVAMDGTVRYPQGYVLRICGRTYKADYTKSSGHWIMSWIEEAPPLPPRDEVSEAPKPAPVVEAPTGNLAAPMDPLPVPEDLYKSASDSRDIKNATKETKKFVKQRKEKEANAGGLEVSDPPLGDLVGSSPKGDAAPKSKGAKKKKKKSKADQPPSRPPPKAPVRRNKPLPAIPADSH